MSDSDKGNDRHRRAWQRLHHTRRDPHRGHTAIPDIILGGQDGLVNVLGVILGIAAATRDPRIIIAAGMAATFAESVSMAAVAYTSRKAHQDIYESERKREHRHVDIVPDIERDEIREIYRQKGFKGKLLERIVDVITANKDIWVEVMMAEELQLSPVHRGQALHAAGIVGLSSLIGSLIPVVPFFILPLMEALMISVVISGMTLFATGAYKAYITIGRPTRSGLEMAAIGLLSALVGYLVGLIFKLP